jgi:hypothetical protein
MDCKFIIHVRTRRKEKGRENMSRSFDCSSPIFSSIHVEQQQQITENRAAPQQLCMAWEFRTAPTDKQTTADGLDVGD